MTNELYHHGRLNQKWGVRNGPPYPLSRATVKRVYSKKRRGLFGYLDERKEKKEAEKKAQAERQAEEAKERALKEGSATDLLPYLDQLTTKELQDAANRIQWTQKIKEYALNERSKEWNAMNRTMKKIGDVKDWAKTGSEILKAIASSYKSLSDLSKDNKDDKEQKDSDKKK